MVPQDELFSFIFLEELKTPKRYFKINWPLAFLNYVVALVAYWLVWEEIKCTLHVAHDETDLAKSLLSKYV